MAGGAGPPTRSPARRARPTLRSQCVTTALPSARLACSSWSWRSSSSACSARSRRRSWSTKFRGAFAGIISPARPSAPRPSKSGIATSRLVRHRPSGRGRCATRACLLAWLNQREQVPPRDRPRTRPVHLRSSPVSLKQITASSPRALGSVCVRRARSHGGEVSASWCAAPPGRYRVRARCCHLPGDAIVAAMGQNLRPSRLTHRQRDLLWLVAGGAIAFVIALVATGLRP
jgi:hypothetical protein